MQENSSSASSNYNQENEFNPASLEKRKQQEVEYKQQCIVNRKKT